MFNSGYKKEAVAEAERTQREYQSKYEDTINNSSTLYEQKEKAVAILKRVDTYIYSLSNRPAELDKTMSQITVRRHSFENEVDELKHKNTKVAVATTFATVAYTGSAMATLTGAAATNAALAWIGGGSLAAGGGGLAAGGGILAMTGPVGWAIGGAALLGGGLMASGKNKKIAEEAERQTRKMIKQIDELRRIDTKVHAEVKAINPLNSGVNDTLDELLCIEHRDYKLFSKEEKNKLMQLMNASESLSKRIGVKIA